MIKKIDLKKQKIKIELKSPRSYEEITSEIEKLAKRNGLDTHTITYSHGLFGRVRILSFSKGRDGIYTIAHLKKSPYWNPTNSSTYYLCPGKSKYELSDLLELLK